MGVEEELKRKGAELVGGVEGLVLRIETIKEQGARTSFLPFERIRRRQRRTNPALEATCTIHQAAKSHSGARPGGLTIRPIVRISTDAVRVLKLDR